ncbi:MAG TPA: 6,7-dimethyl-8-ribityllumazine synthase [Planctomycetota bacterium]|nr:6,7-dimethyl-8-ribityllumazine synthase [Planctomycetota bacterium]
MPKVIEGQLTIKKNTRFGIAVARTNSLITERLLEGALDCLLRHGAADDDITVVKVPGAYELPAAVQALCAQKGIGAVIALGCVIRGGTPHFDYVAGEATRGIGHAALHSNVPVAFGVLTCDNLEQALERAGAKGGNKGWEAAMSAIEMADLMGKIKG